MRRAINVITKQAPLPEGKYKVKIEFKASPFGSLEIKVEDSIAKEDMSIVKIPRNDLDDYSEEAIKARQKFINDFVKKNVNPDFEGVNHITKYSFDPHITQGNCEHFVGVAQVPMGIAGPLKINGEHAKGEFLIPLATAEGTLVASYNRGMKVINLSGGATCTVIGDAMQRAPVFVFENAREAREFEKWVQANFKKIAEEAEATSSVAKLHT